jgi:phosphatidylglycerol:prolipoprotein diacylglycerol transferase
MHPILFQIGDYTIYSYPVAMSLALLVSLLMFASFAKKKGYDYFLIFEGGIVVELSGLVGARIVSVLLNLGYYLTHLDKIFMVVHASFSVHGAIVGSLAGALLWCYLRNVNFLDMADMMMPFYAVGYTIVRVGGCFMAGCCYGKVTDLPWGVVMVKVDALPRHPVQLYSALGALAGIFIFKKFYEMRPFKGANVLLMLFLYGILRFITEFFREEPVFWHGLSLAQVVSLLLSALSAAVGAAVLLYLRRRKLNPESAAAPPGGE